MAKMLKKIKILTVGGIKIKGFINGPILTPYYEDIDTIFALITGGVKVVEVLEDNTELQLDVSNFNTNNNKKKNKVVKEKPKAVEVVKEPVLTEKEAVSANDDSVVEEVDLVESEPEEKQEEVLETLVEEDTKKPTYRPNNKKNKKW